MLSRTPWVALLVLSACASEGSTSSGAEPLVEAGTVPTFHHADHPALGDVHLEAARSVRLTTAAWSVGLRVAAVDGADVADVAPVARGEGVVYPRASSSEWYALTDAGLEQGITIFEPTGGDDELVVAVEVRGLEADVHASFARLLSAGREVARYDHLLVVDATGRVLPSFMRGGGHRIELVVDVLDAEYPVIVDPLVWDSASLDVSDLATCGGAGGAATLAARPDALVIGAPDACVAGRTEGAVLVFDRTGESWFERALIPSGAEGSSFGAAVALTADALLVAAPDAELVERFARVGPRYIIDSTLPLRTDAERPSSGSVRFGEALAADAVSVVVGAPGLAPSAMDGAGGVFVYRPVGGSWSPQQTLTAETPAAGQGFGAALAMDDDDLVVVSDAGVHVFGRPAPEVRFTHQETLIATNVGDVALRGDTLLVARTTPEVRVFEKDADGAFVLTDTLSLSAAGGDLLAVDGQRFVVRGGGLETFIRAAADFTSEGAVAGAPTSLRGLGLVGTQVLTLDDAGAVAIFRSVATDGSICTEGRECQSGFCADGVCCESACGGAGDCQACSVVAGSSTDGLCEAAVAGTICRGQAGACDAAEICDGTRSECPADVIAPAAEPCRPAAGPCDVQDVCTGLSPFCPRDRVEPVGTSCRVVSGDCDVEESCDGIRPICPADRFVAAGMVCRRSAGVCDVVESCDGASAACPVDAFEGFGSLCRDVSGACDAPEACDGASAGCPTDIWAEDGASCRDGDVCTMDDQCLAGRCVSGPMMCEEPPVFEDPEPPPPSSGGCSVPGDASGPSGPPVFLLGWLVVVFSRRWR